MTAQPPSIFDDIRALNERIRDDRTTGLEAAASLDAAPPPAAVANVAVTSNQTIRWYHYATFFLFVVAIFVAGWTLGSRSENSGKAQSSLHQRDITSPPIASPTARPRVTATPILAVLDAAAVITFDPQGENLAPTLVAAEVYTPTRQYGERTEITLASGGVAWVLTAALPPDPRLGGLAQLLPTREPPPTPAQQPAQPIQANVPCTLENAPYVATRSDDHGSARSASCVSQAEAEANVDVIWADQLSRRPHVDPHTPLPAPTPVGCAWVIGVDVYIGDKKIGRAVGTGCSQAEAEADAQIEAADMRAKYLKDHPQP